MSRDLPEAEFGPPVGFREWSLLENPRAGLKEGDVLTVHVCQVRCKGKLGGTWGVMHCLGMLF